MTAIVGTHTEEELLNMEPGKPHRGSRSIFRADFFKNPPPNKGRRPRVRGDVGLLDLCLNLGWALNPLRAFRCDTDHLRQAITDNCGNLTFQEAFDRTGRIINITVAPMNRTDPPRLLNYLTAPHVLVWSAALASSAVPGVFEPQTLMVKEPDGTVRAESNMYHSDGSMEADLPMLQLSELFNVNHFIISQVNPHATLLSTLSLGEADAAIESPGLAADTPSAQLPVYGFFAHVVGFIQHQLRGWARNMLRLIRLRTGVPEWTLKRGIVSTVMQDYEGRAGTDISILPWAGDIHPFAAVFKVMQNISGAEYRHIRQVGERNTWPKLAKIRCHCDIEMALERCVQRLRKRLANEAAERRRQMYQSHSRLSFSKIRSANNLAQLSEAAQANADDERSDPYGADPEQQLEGRRLTAGAECGGEGDEDAEEKEGALEDLSLYTSPSLVPFSGLAVTDGFDRKSLSLERLEEAWHAAILRRAALGEQGEAESAEAKAGKEDETNGDFVSEGNGAAALDPLHSRVQGANTVKSTSMANFYYRRAKSANDLAAALLTIHPDST